MRLIIILTLRSIQRRPLRNLLSLIGISIGVAGILALGITNQAALGSINQIFEESGGKIDLIVTSRSGNDTVPSVVVEALEKFENIQTVLPVLKINTTLANRAKDSGLELNFLGIQGDGILIHGVNPVIEKKGRDYTITHGMFLDDSLDAYEIVLVESFAQTEDIDINDQIEILTPNGVEKLRVKGLMAREGPGQTNNGAFGIVPIETAQYMFNHIGEYDQIELLIDQGIDDKQSVEKVKEEIQRRLGSGYSVTYPAGQGERMSQMLSNYQIGLNFLSGIALFVGAFLIYNAFAMSVVERTREFGLLRTIGMAKQQVIIQVLIEALTIGVIGASLGLGLGYFGSRGLISLMGSLLGTEIGVDLKIPLETLLLSLGVGIGVTIIAATVPSIQAGRVSPITALRVRGRSQGGWMVQSGWIVGIIMLLISTILLIWNPFLDDPNFRLGSLTVFLMFGGITLIIPAIISRWEKIARPVLGVIYGNSGRIGSRNIERSVSRTTLTVGALLIGVAMILVVRIMTTSFENDLKQWIAAYLGGDIYVQSDVPLRPEISHQISRVTGVNAATSIHYELVEFMTPSGDMEEINFMAVDPATYSQVTSFVFSDSMIDRGYALKKLNLGGSIFVSSVLSEKYAIELGDTVLIRTNLGLLPFEVAGVIIDFFNQGLVVTGNRHDLRRFFRSDEVSTILISKDPEYQAAEVIRNIDSLYGKRYQLSMESNEDIQARVSNLINQAFSMFDIMAILAVMIASFGIINTLTMNIIERTREIGMLRAIGMTRQQVVKMVLSESGLMGLIGGVIGLVFGIFLARIFLTGMTAMSGYQLDFIVPPSGIIISLIIAFVISQITAIQPARKAAKIKVLEAIQYE